VEVSRNGYPIVWRLEVFRNGYPIVWRLEVFRNGYPVLILLTLSNNQRFIMNTMIPLSQPTPQPLLENFGVWDDDEVYALLLEAIEKLLPTSCYVETNLSQRYPQWIESLETADDVVCLGVAQAALDLITQRTQARRRTQEGANLALSSVTS
jgi:hypothetical protein